MRQRPRSRPRARSRSRSDGGARRPAPPVRAQEASRWESLSEGRGSRSPWLLSWRRLPARPNGPRLLPCRFPVPGRRPSRLRACRLRAPGARTSASPAAACRLDRRQEASGSAAPPPRSRSSARTRGSRRAYYTARAPAGTHRCRKWARRVHTAHTRSRLDAGEADHLITNPPKPASILAGVRPRLFDKQAR